MHSASALHAVVCFTSPGKEKYEPGPSSFGCWPSNPSIMVPEINDTSRTGRVRVQGDFRSASKFCKGAVRSFLRIAPDNRLLGAFGLRNIGPFELGCAPENSL